MASTAVVPLDKYLNSSYEPDREFVHGVLVERNVGDLLHSLLLTRVLFHFARLQDRYRIQILPSVRLQIDRSRYRVPDLVVLEKPYRLGKFLTDIPVVTVEITSPEDSFDHVMDKCFEYEALGVRNILIMQPEHRCAWLFEQNNLRILTGDAITLKLTNATLDLPFGDLFAKLPKR